MSNKEKFMQYAIQRIKEKESKSRRLTGEANITSLEGFERCGRGKWRLGQR